MAGDPVNRGLVSLRPDPLSGGIECMCDCGTTTIVVLQFDHPETYAGGEVAFTCDGCGSSHWLVIAPKGDGLMDVEGKGDGS